MLLDNLILDRRGSSVGGMTAEQKAQNDADYYRFMQMQQAINAPRQQFAAQQALQADRLNAEAARQQADLGSRWNLANLSANTDLTKQDRDLGYRRDSDVYHGNLALTQQDRSAQLQEWLANQRTASEEAKDWRKADIDSASAQAGYQFQRDKAAAEHANAMETQAQGYQNQLGIGQQSHMNEMDKLSLQDMFNVGRDYRQEGIQSRAHEQGYQYQLGRDEIQQRYGMETLGQNFANQQAMARLNNQFTDDRAADAMVAHGLEAGTHYHPKQVSDAIAQLDQQIIDVARNTDGTYTPEQQQRAMNDYYSRRRTLWHMILPNPEGMSMGDIIASRSYNPDGSKYTYEDMKAGRQPYTYKNGELVAVKGSRAVTPKSEKTVDGMSAFNKASDAVDKMLFGAKKTVMSRDPSTGEEFPMPVSLTPEEQDAEYDRIMRRKGFGEQLDSIKNRNAPRGQPANIPPGYMNTGGGNSLPLPPSNAGTGDLPKVSGPQDIQRLGLKSGQKFIGPDGYTYTVN